MITTKGPPDPGDVVVSVTQFFAGLASPVDWLGGLPAVLAYPLLVLGVIGLLVALKGIATTLIGSPSGGDR